MAASVPIQVYRLTNHARTEMTRRQIQESDVASVLAAPEQTETLRAGREVYQSRVMGGTRLPPICSGFSLTSIVSLQTSLPCIAPVRLRNIGGRLRESHLRP